ncbi:MAG: AI-2E family transporter [Chromatiaceae bacterium]|jgi:predicted PurR-regulated permease PerM
MTTHVGFTPPGRALLVAAALVIVITGVHLAAPVLAPVLLAVFIAVVATPPLRWLQSHGWPKWLALVIVVFVLLDLGSILALLASGAIEGFRNSLPSYQERLVLLSQELAGWLEAAGVTTGEAMPSVFDPAQTIGVLRRFLSSLGGLFAQGALVMLAVVFILLEAPGLPAKLKVAFDLDDAGKRRFRQVFEAINRYMLIKSLTSLATAVLLFLWLRVLGVDFAVLWGILGFVLNFVPFVGSVLMTIPPTLLALVQIDLGTALLVALGSLTVNTVIGSILEPRIMGRGLGISTLAVFLSLLFWGWLLGSVGVFLSVPLTMALMVGLDASPYTRPLAVLLGPEVREAPSKPQPAPLPEETGGKRHGAESRSSGAGIGERGEDR